MSDVVIKVENLSKQYRLGTVGTGTLSHDLNRWWCRLRGKEDPYLKVTEVNIRDHPPNSSDSRNSRSTSSPDYVWALKDINFEVKRGEVLGIIGKNGAGKSTLLKILSRITSPTQGHAKINGRIASLLEVGVGFHPELTGRENIFLNGAIMGMSKAETAAKLDEIVDFSGCERYVDTPVKRYSSGMKVRLGFAVAAHLDPEILIVDEVLAVGDVEFQKKCLGKMKDIAGHGRTVLFVSHNMTAVRTLCSEALLLRDGGFVVRGEADAVVDAYLEGDSEEVHEVSWDSPEEAPGNKKARIKSMRLRYGGSEKRSQIYTSTPLEIDYEFWNLREQKVHISTHLRKPDRTVIFNTWSEKVVASAGVVGGTLRIPGDFLNDGFHILDFMVVADAKAQAKLKEGLAFMVHDGREGSEWFGKVLGTIRPIFLRFPLESVNA